MPQSNLTTSFQDFSTIGEPREFYLADAPAGAVIAVEAGASLVATDGVQVGSFAVSSAGTTFTPSYPGPAGSAQFLRYRVLEGSIGPGVLWVAGPASSTPSASTVPYTPANSSLWLPTVPTTVGVALDIIAPLLALIGQVTYGGGEDGAAIFDGINTFPFATLVGSTYTLTRAPFLTSGHILPGITVKTNGYRGPFCNGGGACLPFINDGTIDVASGKDAVGATAGGTSNLGSLGIGMAGGNGRSNNTGLAGSNQSNGLKDSNASGGAGGAGGVNAGGAGGTYSASTSGSGGENMLITNLLGFLSAQSSGGNQAQLLVIGGGAGGGGGGSDNVDTLGGGGGGAAGIGILPIFYFINNGTVRSVGGRGGDAAGAHNGGGGGGGGGGIILSLSRYRAGTSWNPATPTSWANLSGGAGGAAVGTGVAGTVGNAGHVNVHWA